MPAAVHIEQLRPRTETREVVMQLRSPERTSLRALLCAAALGLAAVGALAAPDYPGDGVPPPAWSAVPLPQGSVERAVDKIPDLARELMEATGVPGLAVAVVYQDETIFTAGYGVRVAGRPEAVDANTVFQLASVSKPIGATVVAAAVGKGTIRWDTPVSCVYPGFALADPWVTEQLTIADLYAHRSGLPDHAGDSLEDLGFDRDEVLSRLRHLPLAPFRATYQYTNFGVTAAAEAVAKASGATWPELSARTLYAPLGMTSTSSTYDDFVKRTNRAIGHVCEGACPTRCTHGGGRWVPSEPGRQPDAQSPAGGVSSSVRDMTAWMRMVLAGGSFEGKPVVDDANGALRAALAPHIRAQAPAPPADTGWRQSFYGYGFNVGDDPTGRVRFSHSGGFALGAGTAVTMVPALGLGIVTLTNASPTGVAEAMNLAFVSLVETGSLERDWLEAIRPLIEPMYSNHAAPAEGTRPTNPRSHRDLSAYAFSYSNAYYGRVQILQENGVLVMLAGPEPKRFVLEHWDGDRFIYDPEGEDALGPAEIAFDVDEQGYAVSVTVKQFEEGVRTLWREPKGGFAGAGEQPLPGDLAAKRCGAQVLVPPHQPVRTGLCPSSEAQ